jgi:hypothetical protein
VTTLLATSKIIGNLFLGSSLCWSLMAPRLLSAEIQLPPADDIPEEILRTEIIFEARSPIDGKPMTAQDYAELQNQLQASATEPTLSSQVRQLIFLLQLRQAGRSLLPILP